MKKGLGGIADLLCTGGGDADYGADQLVYRPQDGFFIEAVVAVVAILAIAIVHIRFQSYVYTSVKAAKKVLFGKEYDALEQFTMPMAIVGEAGDIVWANAAFLESAGRARDCRGENVMKFLYPHTIQQVVAAKGRM